MPGIFFYSCLVHVSMPLDQAWKENHSVGIDDVGVLSFQEAMIRSSIGNPPIFDPDGLFGYELSSEGIEECPIHDGSVRRKIA